MKNYLAEIFPNPCTIGPQRVKGPIWHGRGAGTSAQGSIGGLPARPTGASSQSNWAPWPPQAAAGGRWHSGWLTRPGLVPAVRRRWRVWAPPRPPRAAAPPAPDGTGGEAVAQRDPPCARAAVSQGALCKGWPAGPRHLPLGPSPRAVAKGRPPPAGAIKRPAAPRRARLSPRAPGRRGQAARAPDGERRRGGARGRALGAGGSRCRRSSLRLPQGESWARWSGCGRSWCWRRWVAPAQSATAG